MAICPKQVPASGQEEVERVHRIGILAKRGKDASQTEWDATAKYLTDKIPGNTFEIYPLDFDEISDAVVHQKISFLLANPAIYLPLYLEERLRPLVTLENLRGDKGYSVFGSVIFVKKASSISTLKDLKTATFLAVDEKSLGGWMMAWRELKKKGLKLTEKSKKVHFAGTHDQVVYAIRDGKYDVGIVRTDILERMDKEGQITMDDFRVLFADTYNATESFPFLRSTPLYPEWPLAAVSRTPEPLSKAVSIALLQMPRDAEAAIDASITGWDVTRNYHPIHEIYKDLHQGPYQTIEYFTYRDIFQRYRSEICIGGVLFLCNLVCLFFLIRLKRLLRADIKRRKNIEYVLKTTNKRYYDEMMKQVYAKEGNDQD